jgi:ADP-ribosylglycohydrolase
MDQHAYHTIPNAMIIAASLLYGEGDFEKSVYMSTGAAFRVSSNGSTVGAVLGMAKGIDVIPQDWLKLIRDSIPTSLFNVGTVKVRDTVRLTMEHINNR